MSNVRLHYALHGRKPVPARGNWRIRLFLLGVAIGVMVTYLGV